MSEILKPCPFCGGEVEVFELSWTATTFGGHMYAAPFWQIRCKDCRVTLGDFKTKQDAFDAWNTRYYPNTRADRTCHPVKHVYANLSGTDCPAWKCSECGELFEDGARYCSQCGARVVDE